MQVAGKVVVVTGGGNGIGKHENHTPIGAFKVRGGLVYLSRAKRERPQLKGVIAATRGNHGQSLAFAGRRTGVRVTIVVPHGNSTEKNAAMRAPRVTGATRCRLLEGYTMRSPAGSFTSCSP